MVIINVYKDVRKLEVLYIVRLNMKCLYYCGKVFYFFSELRIDLLCGLVILFLVRYLKELIIFYKVFIVILFVIFLSLN